MSNIYSPGSIKFLSNPFIVGQNKNELLQKRYAYLTELQSVMVNYGSELEKHFENSDIDILEFIKENEHEKRILKTILDLQEK